MIQIKIYKLNCINTQYFIKILLFINNGIF